MLGIMALPSGYVTKIADVDSFIMATDTNPHLAYRLKASKSLILRTLPTGAELRLADDVDSFAFDDKARFPAYVTQPNSQRTIRNKPECIFVMPRRGA